MTAQTDSQKRRRRRLLHEALICVALFGAPALVLYPYTHWRPAAEFHATVRTRALNFTVGQDYTGTGLFTGGRADLVFEHFDRVKLPAGQEIKDRRIGFSNVDFQSLPLPAGARIVLQWDPGKPAGVRISASYQAAPSSAVRVFFWDKQSQAQSDSGALAIGSDGAADIYPAPNAALTVSLDPHSDDPKKPSELTFDSSYPVYLSTKDPILFTQRSGSAIVGYENVVDVLNAGRKQKVLQSQSLLIDCSGVESRISGLRIGKDGITVDVQGTAGVLTVDGRDIRPSPVEYLRSNGILSTWFTTSILIGTAGLTVATRFGLVKLLGKGG